MMIILSVIASLGLGIIGTALNNDFGLNIPDLGAILSVVTMGTFIMIEVKKQNKK